MLKVPVAIAVLAFILGGAAEAQTAKTARSAASLDCSKQADDQGLHGKARKTFRKKCLKEARKKG